MSTYKITAPDGNSYNVTAPDTASQDEVLNYAKQNYKKASNASMFQKGAQMATLPFRGYRGAAVGLENLIAHPTQPGSALQRASEAVKTGFQPKGIAETGASMLGESVPLMPLGGVLGEGGKLAQLAKMAGLGGGMSALTQTAEEGKPTVGRTALSAGLSAAPTAAMQGFKSIFPEVAGKFTKVPGAAYRGLTSAFKKAFPGTEESITAQSSKVAPTLEEAYDVVNKRLNSRKQYMGMNMTPKEAQAEVIATGGEPRTPGRIATEFKQIQKRSAPIVERTEESTLINPKTNKPFQKVIRERGISKGEKLRRLSDFETDINKQTGGHYTTDVLQTKQAIRNAAEKTGGTSYKILTKFKQQWGQLKGIEEQLGTKLSDPTTAGRDIENIVRKSLESPEKLNSSDMIKLEGVRKLEQVTGKKILDPLQKQIVSSYTNTALSPLVPKGMLGKMLLIKYWPEGLASFVLGSPKAMGKVATAVYNPPGMVSKATKAITPSIVSQMLRKNREDTDSQR